MCGPAGCQEVVRSCTEGAIRFDPSGALYRLTSAGWASACRYTTCGDRVLGPQLSPAFAFGSLDPSCGPEAYDVTVVDSTYVGDGGANGSVSVCVLQGRSACPIAMISPPPATLSPISTDVFYYPCMP
jgi:hypothetical protein